MLAQGLKLGTGKFSAERGDVVFVLRCHLLAGSWGGFFSVGDSSSMRRLSREPWGLCPSISVSSRSCFLGVGKKAGDFYDSEISNEFI